jgi:hypothetical protein
MSAGECGVRAGQQRARLVEVAIGVDGSLTPSIRTGSPRRATNNLAMSTSVRNTGDETAISIHIYQPIVAA